jgi:glycine/D-amino acid oxidase-like deaminating enzyme
MKIVVIGAGIIGITTPGELESDGHPIQVFERRDAAAEKSSFANAMGIAPGHLPDRQQVQAGLRGCDARVVCAGTDAARIVRQVGLNTPPTPMHGHAVSAPILAPRNAPKSVVMGERHEVLRDCLAGVANISDGVQERKGAGEIADMVECKVTALDGSGFDSMRIEG